jgi:hypothetical protein
MLVDVGLMDLLYYNTCIATFDCLVQVCKIKVQFNLD